MFRSVSLAALALALGFAAAPAVAQNIDRSAIQPTTDTASLYGDFLAGRSALQNGDSRDGAQLLIDAADGQPEGAIRERAFTAALLAGDVPAAARLAPSGPEAGSSQFGLGRLTVAVDALAQGHGAEADKVLGAQPVGLPHHGLYLLLRPWTQAAAGDWDRATAKHEAEGDRLVEILDQSTRATLLEQRRRYADAEALYKALAADPVASGLFQLTYGEFLERRGRAAEAVALYDAALAAPGFHDAAVQAARARAARHETPPALPDIRRGAAQTVGYAAASMSAGRQTETALVYAQLALRLDPGLDQAWVLSGDALTTLRDDRAARAAWGHVGPNSRFAVDARTRTAYSLQRAGDAAGALVMARAALVANPTDLQAHLVLADILRTEQQYPEALAVLDKLVSIGGGADWRVLYMRGDTRERLGRWSEAEADLKQALMINPGEPELLNYLGFQWIDRGEDIKGGLQMVEKAVVSRPASGAMQDSLGWAHYKLADYDKAVEVLETAISLDAADPSINDHLGDAYWMAGRRDEAVYQWRRVLTLSPEPKLKAAAETKLKDGLGPRTQVAASGK